MIVRRPGARSWERHGSWILPLCIIFIAGLALRFYGLDWDDGADLHPDELFVAKIVLVDRIHLDWPPDLGSLLDPATSGLNPRSVDPATGAFREFAYGSLPLWVTDAVAWVLSRITGANWNAMDHAYLVGRALSALLSALTIVVVALIGKRLAGRTVGLLSAFFAAVAPMSIQLAHFFTTDSWLTFFVALSLLFAVKAAEDGRSSQFAAAGAACGLAMATKGSVFTLLVPIVAAAGIAELRRREMTGTAIRFAPMLRRIVLAGACAGVAFALFEPYALLRPLVYLQSLRTQADIVSGTFDVPFTRVYVDTTPLLYQIEQFVRWGYGPVAGLLALFGLGLVAMDAVRNRTPAATVLAVWLLSYGAVLLAAEAKFLRYLEPLAPVFAVAAAFAATSAMGQVRARLNPGAAMSAATVAVAAAILWTAAFASIYAHENPRVTASKAIYAAIPPGSKLTAEYWDDALPRAFSFGMSPPGSGFGIETLDLYRDAPPAEVSAGLFERLSSADFIVQSSERVEFAVRAAPWRYPVQGRFFDQLERGAIGFEQNVSFSRTPSLGGLAFDDWRADESFVNYDHPRVTIYRKSEGFSQPRYDAAMAWALQRPWFPQRHAPAPTLLLDTPVGENPSVDDARWSAIVTGETPAALVVWLAFLAALLAVGLPWARMAMPAFPDGGWGLARTVALLLAAYPVWLGASLQLFAFRAIWVVVALVTVAFAGWRLTRRPGGRWRPARSTRTWLHAELAFWAVFLLFLALRFANPDSWHPVWGGEKPMEFAQINAIGRSAYFPPYDPWFADGYINYYYYGFYLIAFMLKATGIPLEVGFNLAQPAIMAMLASAAFSCAAAIGQRLTRIPTMALVSGWAATISVSILGNLTNAQQLLPGTPGAFDPFQRWTWDGSRAIANTITEFPFFTGLYADLHAHVVALPITVLVVSLCFALVSRRAGALGSHEGHRSTRAEFSAQLGLLALALGSLFATNAWDVPVYAILAVVAMFMYTRSFADVRLRLLWFLGGSATVLGGAWLLFQPFHAHYVALFNQVALVQDPSNLIEFLSHFGGLLAISVVGMNTLLSRSAWQGHRSSAWLAVAVGGTALGLALIVLAGASEDAAKMGALILMGAAVGPSLFLAAGCLIARFENSPDLNRVLSAGVLTAGAIAAVGGALAGRTVFGLMFGLGAAAAAGWLTLRRPADQFVLLLLAAAFFTAAGVEVVVVADDLLETTAYRMNTVFKFYNQVWILLSLSAASLLAMMMREAMRAARRSPGRQAPSVTRGWARLGIGVTSLVLVASLAYPALAVGPRVAQRFAQPPPLGTLDAFAWMKTGTVPVTGASEAEEIAFAGDSRAIAWLWENVAGTPVIAEASIGPYRCNGSRISIATGLPTIIGWERHQQQQRYPETLPARVADVRTLYISPDVAEKEAILARYNVEYVVVGALERVYPLADNACTPTGSTAGIAAFDRMVGRSLEVAFADADTVIYRVVRLGGA